MGLWRKRKLKYFENFALKNWGEGEGKDGGGIEIRGGGAGGKLAIHSRGAHPLPSFSHQKPYFTISIQSVYKFYSKIL